MLFNTVSYSRRTNRTQRRLDNHQQTITLPSSYSFTPIRYAENQKESPIILQVDIVDILCDNLNCLVKVKPIEVLRNRSNKSIILGKSILINIRMQKKIVCNEEENCKLPQIGGVYENIQIPKTNTTRYVWIKPSNTDNDYYQTAAGPYSFGPDLKEDYPELFND